MKSVLVSGTEYHSKKIEEELSASFRIMRHAQLGGPIKSAVDFLILLMGCDVVVHVYAPSGWKRYFVYGFLPLLFRKKVVFQWIGTDVLELRDTVKGGMRLPLLDKITHCCECGWIRDELEELGVFATVGPFITFASLFDQDLIREPSRYGTRKKESKKLVVMTYLGGGREGFYGLEMIDAVVKKFTDVEVRVIGSTGAGCAKSNSIKYLGWVDRSELLEEYRRAHVFLRLPEHDGLSYSLLEAMSFGLHVAYTYEYPFTKQVTGESSLSRFIEDAVRMWRNDSLNENLDAITHIRETYVDNNLSRKKLIDLLQAL